MSSCHLLELPRELRDEIYSYYLATDSDGAYVYNFETNKLRRADKQPIDLGLMYTCKTIAVEMNGMPLRLNTVAFQTIYSDSLRITAARFDSIFIEFEDATKSLFDHAAPKIDARKIKTVTDQFPVLKAGLKDYHHQPPIDPIYSNKWPMVPSTRSKAFREAVRSFMDQNPGLVIPGTRPLVHWGTVTQRKIVSTELDPWMIPTDSELDDLVEVSSTRPPGKWQCSSMWKYRDWFATYGYGKYRFSAASAAIYFLRSRPQTRLQLRDVLIHEDYVSVARPARHSIGLIPFCRENPKLRITRRVSLWRNLMHYSDRAWIDGQTVKFEPTDLANNVAEWMVEAKGMPADQFILMLDADPAPEKATEIFNIALQRAAALQQVTLVAPIPDYGFGNEPYLQQTFYRQGSQAYSQVGFPEMLQDLVRDPRSGVVQCNFDPGTTQLVRNLLEEYPDYCCDQWISVWFDLADTNFETEPSLPSWRELKLELLVDDWVALCEGGASTTDVFGFVIQRLYPRREGNAEDEADNSEDGEDSEDWGNGESAWVWDGFDDEFL